jgi:hypothetical protein
MMMIFGLDVGLASGQVEKNGDQSQADEVRRLVCGDA